MNGERVVFTKAMRHTHTILIPTMLPMHFELLARVLDSYGYRAELLTNTGFEVRDCGLKYVHNDTCYPALLIIGQLISALQSGKYDPDKTAILFTQTGGGCRASNYIPLMRKALQKAGLGRVPVISLNIAGLEKNPGFRLTPGFAKRMLYAVYYGDLLMNLVSQCRPYEQEPDAARRKAREWVGRLAEQLSGSRRVDYRHVLASYAEILRDFESLPRTGTF